MYGLRGASHRDHIQCMHGWMDDFILQKIKVYTIGIIVV